MRSANNASPQGCATPRPHPNVNSFRKKGPYSPFLKGVASRQQVLGVVVSDLFERAVFELLGGLVGHDGHCDLYVCVAHLRVPEDEVAFQLSYASDADLATLRASVSRLTLTPCLLSRSDWMLASEVVASKLLMT